MLSEKLPINPLIIQLCDRRKRCARGNEKTPDTM